MSGAWRLDDSGMLEHLRESNDPRSAGVTRPLQPAASTTISPVASSSRCVPD